jgi:hypothetical protein
VQLKNDSATQGEKPGGKTYPPEEKNACSIEAMMNGGECEACQ